MMKDLLKNWETDHTGAAIYSLVDSEGKRYIGQTKNLKRRLYLHHQSLNAIYNQKNPLSMEGKKLFEAAKHGTEFNVEVLKVIPWYEVTENNMRFWEKFYVDLCGGLNNTYNTGVLFTPNYGCEDFNTVSLSFRLFERKDADIIKHLDACTNVQGYIKDLIRKDMEQ